MEHGTVTTTNYEDGVVYCNVRAIRMDTEYRNVPLLKPHSGFIQVPKQGETVTMEQLDDGTRFISNVISREQGTPDNLAEGELAVQLDDETRVYFEERDDGNYDLNLDASGQVLTGGSPVGGGFSGKHTDLTEINSDAHHAQVHGNEDHSTSYLAESAYTPEADTHDRYTDSEAIAAVNNDADHGSTASHNYFSGDHGDLIGLGSDDHHAQNHDNADHTTNYLPEANYTPEADTHSRYTDSEAISAAENRAHDFGNNNLLGVRAIDSTSHSEAYIRTKGGGSDFWRFYDEANSQNIAEFREGGDVAVPNGGVVMGNFRVEENSSTNSLDFNYTG